MQKYNQEKNYISLYQRVLFHFNESNNIFSSTYDCCNLSLILFQIKSLNQTKYSQLLYFIKMGQQQATNKLLNPSKSNPFYQLDIRLLQKIQNFASSFPSDIQEVLTEAEQYYIKEPDNFISDFLISQINDRFDSMSINEEAMNDVSNSKTILEIFHINPMFLKHKSWTELETINKFLRYLQSVEEKYWIEHQLYEIIQREDEVTQSLKGRHKLSDKKTSQNSSSIKKNQFFQNLSIRQPLKNIRTVSSYKTQLSQPLFKKLFFYFYFQLIRIFCSSKNGVQRSNAIDYHVNIGRNILKIVSAQFISQEKLFQLLYHLIKIQKTEKSFAQLRNVSEEYEIYCLKHQHSIAIEKNRLQKIKMFTKCYLDELYFLAIKEAEDPEIIEDENYGDSGLMLKNFPINRVKERNRNM